MIPEIFIPSAPQISPLHSVCVFQLLLLIQLYITPLCSVAGPIILCEHKLLLIMLPHLHDIRWLSYFNVKHFENINNDSHFVILLFRWMKLCLFWLSTSRRSRKNLLKLSLLSRKMSAGPDHTHYVGLKHNYMSKRVFLLLKVSLLNVQVLI